VEEGFEGGFVLEACAYAVALFRQDELGFDGVARDDADRWLLAVDEIDDEKKVSDEFSIYVKLRHVGIGYAPQMAASLHLYFERHTALDCDEVIASVFPFLRHVLNGVTTIREVSRGSGDGFLFDHIGHMRWMNVYEFTLADGSSRKNKEKIRTVSKEPSLFEHFPFP